MSRSLCVAVILALVAGAAPAEAAVTRARTLEQLAVDADSVVRGRVVEQTVELESDSGRVRTLSTVEVGVCLRGDDAPGARVVVSQLGGTVGDVTVVASGTVPLAVGQELLLFLRGTGTQRRAPVGLGQGVWFVHRAADGAELLSRERLAPSTRLSGELPRWEELVARIRRAVRPPR